MARRYGLMGLVGVGAASAWLAAAPAWSADSPFVGRWQWNKAQSVLPPGEDAPADIVADIARVDSAHVRWSITMTNAQGRPAVESFDTPANGEFYPISSGTTAAFRLTGSALEATFKGPAGEIDTLTCAVSADRNRMTCNGAVTGPDGKPGTYVDVYDRK